MIISMIYRYQYSRFRSNMIFIPNLIYKKTYQIHSLCFLIIQTLAANLN